MAQAVHAWSAHAAAPLVRLNCATLQKPLIEVELFGYERGAFAGAAHGRAGLLERAHGGTLFLDEVNELPGPAQAKLLRVLEDQRVTRLGGKHERAIDIRVVAATSCDLTHEIAVNRFRQDLYFRLDGTTVMLPPLRARRREDIKKEVERICGGKPRRARRSDKPVAIVKWVDGTVLDTVWQIGR